MIRAIFILIISLQALLGFASSTSLSVTDSLLAKLKVSPHDTTRLQLLEELTTISQSASSALEFADQLYKEAKRQNNSYYICNAGYFHALHYYNNEGDLDSIAKWVNLITPIAQKNKYWKTYFNSTKLLINIYIYKQQYEYAYNEAVLMLEKANISDNIDGKVAVYQCLANIYQIGRAHV